MQKIKLIIVEDEPIVAFDLKRQLVKAGFEVSATFRSGEEILVYLNEEIPDMILMDIRLHGSIDGIDTAHEINKSHSIPVIFLTANTDQDTFNRAKLTFPHAFLSKPFRIKDVKHTIDLALKLQGDSPEDKQPEKYLADRVFIRNSDHLQKVMYDQILYLQADGSYTKIVTKEESYLVSQTLAKAEQKIKVPFLLRIHRSYVVNTRNIDQISDGFVHIGKNRFPVSRAHRDRLNKMFNIF